MCLVAYPFLCQFALIKIRLKETVRNCAQTLMGTDVGDHDLKTRAEGVVDSIRKMIDAGALKVGVKAPSIRRAAEEFRVSKNTVIEAYGRLVAAGLLTARQGSGFVVSDPTADLQSVRPSHVAEAVDIATLLRAQLEESFSVRVGDGRPPPSWTEEPEVRRRLGFYRSSRSASEDGYGSAIGLPELREKIARSFMAREIRCGPQHVIMTFGANHALDLIIRHFLSSGDAALVDDPGYYPLFAKLKLSQVRMVGVARNQRGPDLDDLARKLEEERPKVFFTQSISQNPTASSTALATAHALLNILSRQQILIVQDEPFIDLPNCKGVDLATLDQLQNVITVGTFAKTLSANLRCGYILARPEIIASLTELKMLTTVNSSGHIERLVHGLMEDGRYRKHLRRLSQRIEKAGENVMENFHRRGLEVFAEPTGGYYLYLKLPRGVDDIDYAKIAAREGVFIAPGSVFSVDRCSSSAGMRINIARADDPRFYDFLSRTLRT
jgi:DNA-binding transcriptional MocR family regulator